MRLDESGGDGTSFRAELLRKFELAKSVKIGFEGRNAEQAPAGIGQRLNQFFFAGGGRFEFIDEATNVVLVGFGLVAGHEDGAAGESGFQSV